jgi:uncharacterized surface protein with fasciclin (FAS1) repeats
MKRASLSTAALMAFLAAIPQSALGQRNDIVDVARSAGQFTTLLAALDAAGLTHAIADGGPFTVLAPTDAAFAALPDGTLETLLEPENRGQLQAILQYHVISGRVRASQVRNLRSAETLLGQRVAISHDGGSLKFDDSNVTTADISAGNGIIHIIDGVLLPESQTIPEVASGVGVFGTLLAAVQAAGLGEALSGEGPFTVFAPTDDAFARLPEGTVESLLQAENLPKLAEILKYHVVAGRVYADQALEAERAPTLQGDAVEIRLTGGVIQVNESRVTAADIEASNGVIHVIDEVLLPVEMSPAQEAAMQLMEYAISRGVPLYNAGHPGACAAVYEVAAMALLEMGEELPERARRQLRDSFRASQRTHDMSDRAWMLRHAFDETMRQMMSRVQ